MAKDLMNPLPPGSYETRGPQIVIVTSTALGVCTLVAVLRAYVRARMLRKWGLDDTLAMISYVSVHHLIHTCT